MREQIDRDTDFALDSPFPPAHLASGGVYANEDDPRRKGR
jgi:hypothetical protein